METSFYSNISVNNFAFKARTLKANKSNILILLGQGKSCAEIAEFLGTSPAWVVQKILQYKNVNNKLSKKIISELYKNGLTIEQISKSVGLSVERIKAIILAESIKKNASIKIINDVPKTNGGYFHKDLLVGNQDTAKKQDSNFRSQILELNENTSAENFSKRFNISKETVRKYISDLVEE